MRRSSWRPILLALVLVPAAVREARATPSRADALFLRGKADMAAGQTSAACAAFAESLQLEPAEGTQLALGLCREKEGDLVVAHGLLRDVASHTEREDRRRVSRAALVRVEARIGRLVVHGATTSCTGTLRLDERPLGVDGGREIPVATGPHHLACERAPGAPAWSTTVAVTAGAVTTVEVPVAEAPPVAPPIAPSPTSMALERAPAPRSTSTAWLGWTTGGLGLAALGVGAYFGVRASNGWSAALAKCDPAACRDKSAAVDLQGARTDARIADVAVIAGGALVATGIVLVLVHKGDTEAAARAAIAGGGRVAF